MQLSIPDMHCAHCLASITRALTELDPASDFTSDLTTRQITLDTTASPEAVLAILSNIGFEATQL